MTRDASSSASVSHGQLQTVGSRPRVVLLAEQRLVGEAVRAALNSRHLDVFATEWPDAQHPTPLLRRTLTAMRPHAGVVFGDLENPRRRAHARTLVATVPLRWLLVVSRHDDVSWGDLVAEGATPLPDRITLDDLAASLTRLVSGIDLMSPAARARMVHHWTVDRDEVEDIMGRLARLTPRESEVLHLLATGFTVRRIAAVREVSEATVRTQVKVVLRKLEVNSQLAAAALLARARPEEVAPHVDHHGLDGG